MYREQMIDLINNELSETNDSDEVLIWGAGDYAFNVFAYSVLSRLNITHVVDKNKAGGYFAGMVIGEPNGIEWNKVDTVVILAYYHSDEIEKELRNKYGFRGKIVKPGIKRFEREFYKYDSLCIKHIDAEIKKLIGDNARFKDCYEGKRCFILGNGPSLNSIDLNKIDGEIVLAVNQFYRTNSSIDFQHYVIADSFFFNEDKDVDHGNKFLNGLKQFSSGKDFYLWCPISFRSSIVSMKIDDWIKVRFFYPGRKWENRINDEIDFTEIIPGRYSVIQYCVFMAVFMGIKEIYLLGCEETGIYGAMDNYMDVGYSEYAFGIPEDELKMLKDYNVKIPIDVMLYGYSEIFRGYREIAELCKNKGVEIYTCAPKTLVSGIRYKDFHSIN